MALDGIGSHLDCLSAEGGPSLLRPAQRSLIYSGQINEAWGWGNKTSEYTFDLDDGPLAGILINPDYKQSPKRDSSTDVSFTIVFSNDSARQNHGHDDNASLALMLIN